MNPVHDTHPNPRGERPEAAPLGQVLTFIDGLPEPVSDRDRQLRAQLRGEDAARACAAALELGATYAAVAPKAAAALLWRAADGPPLVAGRALLRLARMTDKTTSTADEPNVTRARELLERAHRVTAPHVRVDDDGLHCAIIAVRIDIAAALRFADATDVAIGVLLRLDSLLREALATPDASDDPDEVRRLAALTSLRLGQILFEADPQAADQHLAHAVRRGTATVCAEAAYERAKLLQHHANGAGPAIQRLYEIAVDEQDPGITPLAAIALGDFLWESGSQEKAKEYWALAGEWGEQAIVDRVARRFEGKWQRERAALRAASANKPLDFARPIDNVVPSTGLGRIATGRAADAPRDEREPRPVIVVGAGTGGHYVLPALRHGYDVLGFVDDSPNARTVDGIEVFGPIDQLGELLRDNPQVDQVIFAIPSASGSTRRRVLEATNRCGREVVSLPPMFELRYGYPLQPQLRPFEVHETFGDRPWLIDRDAHRLVDGRRVAIVGASSVLGVEMARRVAHGHPRHLLLIDEPAEPLMDLAAEIRDERGLLDCDARIVDYSAEEELREALVSVREPDIVFFCGGVMHAPESVLRPRHAVRANVLAVDVVARVTAELRCSELVVASTDRAAHRASAFDMTKALAERAALRAGRVGGPRTVRPATIGLASVPSGLRVSVLRTPNLWARHGAVIGRLADQLARGGPLRVKATRRRFTPAWEAAQAMLRLLGDDHAGGLFALASGEELEIRELAERLLLIHGLTPGRDIKIHTDDRHDTKASLELSGRMEAIGDAEQPANVLPIEPAPELRRVLDERLEQALRSPTSDLTHVLRPYAPIHAVTDDEMLAG